MATATPAADRPHRAAKRYIYAWGDGHAEGNAGMRDLLGGKGAGLAEMTIAGLPTPPGFTITTEACNDYFAAGERLPGRALGRRPGGRPRGRAQHRQGVRRRRQPAPRERPLGRQVLDARDDGHGPQPGPQRGDAPRADRADRQRALRLGRVPAVHPDVRPDRHGGLGRAVRPRPRGRRRRPTARSRTPTSTPPPCRRSSASSRGSSRPTRAATSRRTRTSSSTSRSRRSSRRGSASAPATTARTRASPTTSGPRSTS